MDNILYITADSLRADHVSYFDEFSPADTQNVDSLADDGAAFNVAMAQGTHTVASAPTLLTGEYKPSITDETPTVAEIFRASGYETAAFSTNFHVRGPQLAHLGLDRGFDEFDMCMDELEEKTRLTTKRVSFEIARRTRDCLGTANRLFRWLANFVSYFPRPFVSPVPHAETVNERIIGWVSDTWTGDQPFFIWAFYLDPHEPFLPPERWIPSEYDSSRARINVTGANRKYRYFKQALSDEELELLHHLYIASIEYWDEQVGRLVDDLRNQVENLTVVLSSDHGELFGEHGSVAHPDERWEELIHVPIILNGPAIPDRDIDDVVANVDIPTTLADQTGVDQPESFRGQSLLDRDVESDGCAITVVKSDPMTVVCRTNEWKLVFAPEDKKLYRVDKTLDETDVSDQYPDVTRGLAEVVNEITRDFTGSDEQERTEVDDEIEDRLRDLGYVDM